MSDTVQAVAESLTDEFGRYVKPPKDGTIVWKIGKSYSRRNPNGKIADGFMVVKQDECTDAVYLSSYGRGAPEISRLRLDYPSGDGYIFAEFLDVYRELEREAVAQLEYIQRAIEDNTGPFELHRLEAG